MTEKAKIADFIVDNGITNVVLVAGDAHMVMQNHLQISAIPLLTSFFIIIIFSLPLMMDRTLTTVPMVAVVSPFSKLQLGIALVVRRVVHTPKAATLTPSDLNNSVYSLLPTTALLLASLGQVQ